MSGDLVTAESIERRVEADPNSGCWLWCGYLGERDYGRITTPDGQSRLAHRVSYETYKGSAEGFFVLHKCDTPQCVNPAHLRLGTLQDNVDDRDRKGRWRGRIGAVVPLSVEARADIEQNCVRGSLDTGIRTFARKYGIRPSSVAYILDRRGQADSRRKLSDAQVDEIRRRLAAESGASLAAEFGVTPSAKRSSAKASGGGREDRQRPSGAAVRRLSGGVSRRRVGRGPAVLPHRGPASGGGR